MSDRVSLGGLAADIILNTGTTEQDLAKVQAGLRLVDAEMVSLDMDFRTGTISAAAYLKQVEHLTATYTNAAREADKLSESIKGVGAAGSSGGAGDDEYGSLGAAMRVTRGIRRLAVSLEGGKDAVRSFVTALPMIIGTSLGPLGVAISAIGIVFYELYENWDKLRGLMGDTSPFDKQRESVEGLRKQVEELNNELNSGAWFVPTEHLVDKLREATGLLEKMTREMAAFESLEHARTKDEKKGDKRFRDVMAEAPKTPKELAAEVGDKLAASLGDDAYALLGRAEAEKARKLVDMKAKVLSDLTANMSTPGSDPIARKQMQQELAILQKMIDEFAEKAREAGRKKVAELIGEATTDDKARKELAATLEGTGDADKRKLADKIRGGGETEAERDAADEWQRKYFEKQEKDEEAAAKKEKLRKKRNAQREKDDETRGLRENAEEHRANMAAATEAVPGIDAKIQDDIMRNMIGGGSPVNVREHIREALREAGMEWEQVNDVTKELFEKSQKTVGEKITTRALKGEQSHSEVIDSASLSSKIQSAVSSNETKDQQKQMIDYLAKIANAQNNVLRIQAD